MALELGFAARAQTSAVKIVWFENAIRDMVALRAFIARENADAAQSIARKISDAVEVLHVFPAAGRVGRVTGTRESVIAGMPYVIPYRIRGDRVEILRVLHTARRWRSDL